MGCACLVLTMELKQRPGQPEAAGTRGPANRAWKLLNLKGVMCAWERGSSKRVDQRSEIFGFVF